MIKKIGVLSSGLATGAVINIACLPIITRLYGIESYGVYGIVVAIISFASVVANGRFDQAILASSSKECSVVASAGFLITIPFSFLVFIISLLIYDVHTAAVIGLGVASNSLFQLSYNSFLAKNNLKICALMSVLRVALICSLHIFIALFGFSDSLLYGLIAQSLIIIMTALFLVSQSIFLVSVSTFMDNLDFIKNNSRHALMSSFSHNMPYFLLSIFASSSVVGYYSVVDRVCKIPISLFSQVVRQLFMKAVFEIDDFKKSSRLALKYSKLMFFLGVLGYIAVLLSPETFYEFILGEDWSGIKSYIAFLALGYVFVFSNPPVSGFIVATKNSSILVCYQAIEIAIKVIIFFFLLGIGEPYILLSFSFSLMVYNLLVFIYVLNVSRNYA